MKKCPKCLKNYDDSWSVCLYDEQPLNNHTSADDAVAVMVENSISCQFCKETIKSDAIKCRFCGEFLNGSKNNPTFNRMTKTELQNVVSRGMKNKEISEGAAGYGGAIVFMFFCYIAYQFKNWWIVGVGFVLAMVVSLKIYDSDK